MVRLDRITMQGFKSFAGKVTIPFPSGFNCVCGPNGSGKSNIIDALMFVLGTTSAKSIRAQRLQNLLFNGGRDRKPAEFCEVSLYIDNSDQKVPGEKELKITRRVSRSGVSLYKINGHTESRTKVVELLTSLNISPEGYNIIMQGDVTKIIEMNAQERRGIIDEISGIAEFEDKKEKATRELENVENAVRENMIIVAEKQRMVARLKEEKENAEKYRKFSDDLRQAKASLIMKRRKDFEAKLSAISEEIEKDSIRFEQMEKEFKETEKALETKEISIIQKGDELVKKSRNYDILRGIDSNRTEIVRKKDRMEMNEREMNRLHSMSGDEGGVIGMLSGIEGVHGTVSSLFSTQPKYSIAMEVAIGRHGTDIVTETEEIATRCIKLLKERRQGRARFIPLNRIKSKSRRDYKGDFIGYAIDLIEFDGQYRPAMEYILGSTIVVKNIDIAKKIRGFRVVTLDGDMVETSGAMIGGHYIQKKARPSFRNEIKKLEDENRKLQDEIIDLEGSLEKLRGLEREESEEVKKLNEQRTTETAEIENLRQLRKKAYEERLVLQSRIGKHRIEKAKLEAGYDNVRLESKEFEDVTDLKEGTESELQEKVRRILIELNKIGPVNMKAIDEFSIINVEFEEMKKKLDKLLEEKNAISNIVMEVEKKRYDKFMETFNNVRENFSKTYFDMTQGNANIKLEEDNNISSGLIIEASPVGKKIVNIDIMSGGEKTIASLSFLFAVMQHYSSPFYVLDEVDAALDKSNTRKIVELVRKNRDKIQFVVITHNDFTIAEADKVFGVSMESGVSKVFGIEMPGSESRPAVDTPVKEENMDGAAEIGD